MHTLELLHMYMHKIYENNMLHFSNTLHLNVLPSMTVSSLQSSNFKIHYTIRIYQNIPLSIPEIQTLLVQLVQDVSQKHQAAFQQVLSSQPAELASKLQACIAVNGAS